MTNFELISLRFGDQLFQSCGPGSLVANLDLIGGALAFQFVDTSSNSVKWEVSVTSLGLEDVLVWSKKKDNDVALVVRLRAVSFFGVAEVSPQNRTSSLFVIHLAPLSGLSLLSCLAFGLAKLPMPSDLANELFDSIVSSCSVLRKALARRDLLNRGWTDEQLADGPTLLTMLSSPDLNGLHELHLSSNLPTLQRDARQFQFHERGDEDVIKTPHVSVQPPRKFAKVSVPVVDHVAATVKVLADTPIFSEPIHVPFVDPAVAFAVEQDDDQEHATLIPSRKRPVTYRKGEKPKVFKEEHLFLSLSLSSSSSPKFAL